MHIRVLCVFAHTYGYVNTKAKSHKYGRKIDICLQTGKRVAFLLKKSSDNLCCQAAGSNKLKGKLNDSK